MEGKSKTGMYVGIGLGAVLLIIVVAMVAKPATPAVAYNPALYPAGYNPALYPPGYVPPGVQTDKAALYTGSASVITKALDTFFGTNNQKTT